MSSICASFLTPVTSVVAAQVIPLAPHHILEPPPDRALAPAVAPLEERDDQPALLAQHLPKGGPPDVLPGPGLVQPRAGVRHVGQGWGPGAGLHTG